jgi:hypothetical protein
MTAVEYLFKQYKLTGDISNAQWDKARRMHKEQIVDGYKADRYPCSDEDAEQYYNETFKK